MSFVLIELAVLYLLRFSIPSYYYDWFSKHYALLIIEWNYFMLEKETIPVARNGIF